MSRKWQGVLVALWTVLGFAFMASALESQAAASEARPKAPCPPTPGVLPANDILRGACLFRSTVAFGQDPQGPFANCATCHYGLDTTDRGTHLIQITNGQGQTIQLLRRTPSLLNSPVNFPYGWDGRFGTIQDAARAAILSPVEMGGTTVTDDQLDSLAAFVLSMGQSPPEPEPAPITDQGTLLLIALGKTIFFGKGTCGATCHPAPTFTNNSVTTNQVNADFSGQTDPGAGFVGTGGFREFKVPSLLHLGTLQPFMHNGALARVPQVVRFYNESLGLNLTVREMTGLEYWLRNCLRGGVQNTNRPPTC